MTSVILSIIVSMPLTGFSYFYYMEMAIYSDAVLSVNALNGLLLFLLNPMIGFLEHFILCQCP